MSHYTHKSEQGCGFSDICSEESRILGYERAANARAHTPKYGDLSREFPNSRIKDMVKPQLALDTFCGDEALYLASSVAAHVDILKAGTPRNTLHPQITFEKNRSQNIHIGLGLNPADKVEDAVRFFPKLTCCCFLVLILAFMDSPCNSTWQKNIHARQLGFNLENTVHLVQAGANFLIMGTALFQAADMTQIIKSIREAVA